jgi:hypothetical protein
MAESAEPRKEHEPTAPTASVSVSLPAISIGAGLVGLSALVALIVVTIVTDTGALETIALVLAILSFSVQIVVYIAQAWTSSQQALRAEQLNTQTRELIGRIEAASEGTTRMLEEQHTRVLNAVIGIATRTAQEEGADPDEYNRKFTKQLEELQEQFRKQNAELLRARSAAGTLSTGGTTVYPTAGTATGGLTFPTISTDPYFKLGSTGPGNFTTILQPQGQNEEAPDEDEGDDDADPRETDHGGSEDTD